MSDLISRKGVSAWLYNMGREKLSECVLDENRFPSAENTGLSEQYKFERDVAMAQLAEYDIPFGMKKDEDIVRVVRCKDCENATELYIDGYVECSHWDRVCLEDTYCSYGEKKQVICK